MTPQLAGRSRGHAQSTGDRDVELVYLAIEPGSVVELHDDRYTIAESLARRLEHAIQIIRQDVEGPDLLRDVRTAVTLVAQLDVLEVLALLASEL